MCNCGNSKNQTPDEVADFLASNASTLQRRDGEVMGFALFLVPAPERGILEWSKTLVTDISASEASKRAQHCAAYQWVPYGYTTTHPQRGDSVTFASAVEAQDIKDWICNNLLRCRPGGCGLGCFCPGVAEWCL